MAKAPIDMNIECSFIPFSSRVIKSSPRIFKTALCLKGLLCYETFEGPRTRFTFLVTRCFRMTFARTLVGKSPKKRQPLFLATVNSNEYSFKAPMVYHD
ncbi:predicted protein [Lichtheimia corymbifera JMRC:FSU:9682]|uniref:Uncharacterized protein n=1 Tax=Lichtheimia corymbifera JMRC:FSU:9682 TaxID=1263082 RepID=A0A068RM92_9FUNG|nr:predicted protein [Lichtheimia corymbifera JMRC:FSU:9682]